MKSQSKGIKRRLAALGLCGCLLLAAAPRAAGAGYNGAPTAEGGLYHTLQNVSVYGRMKAYDPEGDPMALCIEVPPKKGTVRTEDTSFVYVPYPDARGEDSFTATVQDRYGNKSREVTVAISIDAAGGQPYFSDMGRHPYEYGAIRLAQAGVMSGEAIGNHCFFYPDKQVSRGEYVVLLLSALGADSRLPVCVNTGLINDGSVPLWLKPYIRRAQELGIVTEDAFDTASVPTRAEAVVLCDRAAGMEDVLKYNLSLNDLDLIPRWAVGSYLNLSAYKMLDLYDGFARPNDPLDRGFASSLVWQLYKYARSGQK